MSGRAADSQREQPFGAYLLERKLAVGGMSEVYLARCRDSGERVVIKRLLPDLLEDDALRSSFDTESRLHRRLRHPGIVGLVEAGTYAGEPFLALEFVDGADLARVLRRARDLGRALEPAACLRLAVDLLDALDAVHNVKGDAGAASLVVHCDVTPSNILVSRSGHAKLGDFGIAWVDEGSARAPDLRGKYAYLAPEQISGESFDHRADLFSLVVVLSEALIGQPLFSGAGQLAVLLAIQEGRIDALRAARPRLPRGLYEILAQALSREPEDRFPSAFELGHALRPFLGDEARERATIAEWVDQACDVEDAARSLEGAVLRRMGVATGAPTGELPEPRPLGESQRVTQPDRSLCLLEQRDGTTRPLHLAKLIELLATGQIRGSQRVDFGAGLELIDRVSVLARYLPRSVGTTRRVAGPGVPDFTAALPESTVADALAWVMRQRESGALFATPSGEESHRTELYFEEGHLLLAVSSEPSTLLGERLVREGRIDRAQLETAVLAMHRYNGQLGDTLIGLGFVDPVDVFKSLRAQGRDRVAALFAWPAGRLAFYRGVEPTKLDLRLDLDVPALVLAGLAATRDDAAVEQAYAARREARFQALAPAPPWAKHVTWPSIMHRVLRVFAGGATLEAGLAALASERPSGARAHAAFSRADLLRAIEACEALALLTRAN